MQVPTLLAETSGVPAPEVPLRKLHDDMKMFRWL
jgi:hypothetical protein